MIQETEVHNVDIPTLNPPQACLEDPFYSNPIKLDKDRFLLVLILYYGHG